MSTWKQGFQCKFLCAKLRRKCAKNAKFLRSFRLNIAGFCAFLHSCKQFLFRENSQFTQFRLREKPSFCAILLASRKNLFPAKNNYLWREIDSEQCQIETCYFSPQVSPSPPPPTCMISDWSKKICQPMNEQYCRPRALFQDGFRIIKNYIFIGVMKQDCILYNLLIFSTRIRSRLSTRSFLLDFLTLRRWTKDLITFLSL